MPQLRPSPVSTPMLDFIHDIVTRQWNDLLARPSGPMSFRFLLQPVMAAIAGIRAGLIDARTARSPYLLMLFSHPREKWPRFRVGISATFRIFLLGIAMDAIYQFIVLKKFYPVEALIVAFTLAVIPYFLIRTPTSRVARWWKRRHSPQDQTR